MLSNSLNYWRQILPSAKNVKVYVKRDLNSLKNHMILRVLLINISEQHLRNSNPTDLTRSMIWVDALLLTMNQNTF